uniref:Uncharacterized protein n=1 Tax=Amphimedon queenslandica TaxID=400682 RepID=A0A1X7TUA9_AMPQE
MQPDMNSQQTLPFCPQQYKYSTHEGQSVETPAQPQTTPESTQLQTTPASVQPQTPAPIQEVPSQMLKLMEKMHLIFWLLIQSQLPLTRAEALQKYHGLLTESKASTLSWKLAKDCIW